MLQVFTKKNADLNRTGRASQTAFLIHRLSFVAANGRDCVRDCSHLCDVRNCFNPDHLQDENALINNSRKGCPGLLACSVHHHVVCNLSPHTLKCIRAERDDVFCCLSLKESDPVGWATQTSHQNSSQSSSSLAKEMTEYPLSDFGDAQWLEAAARDGV